MLWQYGVQLRCDRLYKPYSDFRVLQLIEDNLDLIKKVTHQMMEEDEQVEDEFKVISKVGIDWGFVGEIIGGVEDEIKGLWDGEEQDEEVEEEEGRFNIFKKDIEIIEKNVKSEE